MGKWKDQQQQFDPSLFILPKKLGNCIYNASAIELALTNAHTTWGQGIVQRILTVANFWANKSDTELLSFIPMENPLALSPGQYFGDPLTGGNRLALFTSLETPYRWYNPITKVWWYDGAHVVNPKTKQDTIVKDDGSGFLNPDGFPNPGNRTMFIAAYRLFLIAMLCDKSYSTLACSEAIPQSTQEKYAGAIPHLAEAYILTKDRRYLRTAALLIGKLAEYYPHMAGTHGDGTSSGGMHWGEISTTESFWLLRFFDAYDMIFDGIDKDLETSLANVLKPFSFHQVMYEMTKCAICTCEFGRATKGDWGLRWIDTEIHIAVCMESTSLIQHILTNGEYSLQAKLNNYFYRDGRYHYDSTSYMRLILYDLLKIPFPLVSLPDQNDLHRLYDDPRYPFHSIILLSFSSDTGGLLPTFGDTIELDYKPLQITHRDRGYPFYDVRLEIVARLNVFAGDLFKEYFRGMPSREFKSCREILGDFSTLAFGIPMEEIALEKPFHLSAFLVQDSCITYLRTGNQYDHRHDLVLWGQPSAPHWHGDKLGLWLGGRGRHLAASGGGYPFTWVSPKKDNWELHSAACWVVLIDGKSQRPSSSRLLHFYVGENFQLSAMENRQAYPHCIEKRYCWLIPTPNKKDSFVIDLVQVQGGNFHDYNMRGQEANNEIEIEPPCSWELLSNTVAGVNIPLYSQPGYGWMRALKKSSSKNDLRFIYQYLPINDRELGLRVHLLNFTQERELIYALSEQGGQEMTKARWDPHIIWRNSPQKGQKHRSQFVSILESIEKTPFIHKIQPILHQNTAISEDPFYALGLIIEYKDQYKDYIFLNAGSEISKKFMDPAGFCWESDAIIAFQRVDPQNHVTGTELYDGSFFHTPFGDFKGSPPITGTITAVDYTENRIDFKSDQPIEVTITDLTERIAYIYAPKQISQIFNNSQINQTTYYILKPIMQDSYHISFVTNISLIQSDPRYPSGKVIDQRSFPIKRISYHQSSQKLRVALIPGYRIRIPLGVKYSMR